MALGLLQQEGLSAQGKQDSLDTKCVKVASASCSAEVLEMRQGALALL